MKNKVNLIGHVGADPIVKQVGDSTVANFTLATSEKYKDKQGTKQEKTQWHTLVCWGKLAENVIAKYVKKGSRIDVEGQIEYEEYTDKEGVKRKATKINVYDLLLLDSKGTAPVAEQTGTNATANTVTATNGAKKTATATATSKTSAPAAILVPEDDTDLPF